VPKQRSSGGKDKLGGISQQGDVQSIRTAAEELTQDRVEEHEAGCWPAPGSEDTELGVLMEPEVGHGETEVYENAFGKPARLSGAGAGSVTRRGKF
jgi:hypothetical protein